MVVDVRDIPGIPTTLAGRKNATDFVAIEWLESGGAGSVGCF